MEIEKINIEATDIKEIIKLLESTNSDDFKLGSAMLEVLDRDGPGNFKNVCSGVKK